MIINSQKRSFGRGAKVSLFTLGTMRATESLEKMHSIIKNAYYAGINHIETLEKSWLLSIKWKNNNFSKYVVNKGSICVNGISLTIAKYEQAGEIFTIAIIPHTWYNTCLLYTSPSPRD